MDQRAGLADRLPGGAAGLHRRMAADGGHIPRFRLQPPPHGVEPGKSVPLRDVITPSEEYTVEFDEVQRAIAVAAYAAVTATRSRYEDRRFPMCAAGRHAGQIPRTRRAETRRGAAAQYLCPAGSNRRGVERSSRRPQESRRRHGVGLTCGLARCVFPQPPFPPRGETLERNEMLARVAAENFSRLGATNIEVVNTSAEGALRRGVTCFDWIYADPGPPFG